MWRRLDFARRPRIDLRVHGEALVDLYDKLEPLLDPPADENGEGPKRVMGFRREEEEGGLLDD